MSHPVRLVSWIALAALTLGFAGCGNGGIITFTFTKQSDEKVVEGSNNPLPDFVPLEDSPFNFNINLEQQLEQRDAKGAKDVRLDDLKLLITETEMQGDDTDNFNFLESIEFLVDSENEDKKRLAWRDSVPDGKQELQLEIDDSVNLKPYIEDGMTLETNAEGQAPEDDTSLLGEITIWVKAL